MMLMNRIPYDDDDDVDDISDVNHDHADQIYLSFSAGSPQLLISVAIMNSLRKI